VVFVNMVIKTKKEPAPTVKIKTAKCA